MPIDATGHLPRPSSVYHFSRYFVRELGDRPVIVSVTPEPGTSVGLWLDVVDAAGTRLCTDGGAAPFPDMGRSPVLAVGEESLITPPPRAALRAAACLRFLCPTVIPS